MPRDLVRHAFGFMLAFFASTGTAFAEGLDCETHTARPLTEIVVPLGEPEYPSLSAQAVKLLPGETLCITGTLDQSGQLVDLQVVASGRDSAGPIVELRLEQTLGTDFSIRHSGQKWLYYRALKVVTQQELAFSANTPPVPPQTQRTESWDLGVRKTLIHGFRFGEPPATKRKPKRRLTRDPNKLGMSVTGGLWAGARGFDLDELNDVLLRDGFETLPYGAPMLGVGFNFTLGRLRLDLLAGGSPQNSEQPGSVDFTQHFSEVGLLAGFDVIQYGQFHAVIAGGIVADGLSLRSNVELSLVGESGSWEESEGTHFLAPAVPIEVGTDYFVPLIPVGRRARLVLQFGTRLGWTQQLGDGGWETDAQHDLDGPSVDLSGPRARVSLSFGIQNGW